MTRRQRRRARCFRTFTPQELAECFAPPLGESQIPPRHWPKDLRVCDLPRTSWLPQKWTQAYRNGEGRKRKLYVAPPELGSKVEFNRKEVEVLEGRRLYPMDQHGVCLGNECITKWPDWLPQDWKIGYFKARDDIKVCFLNPAGGRFRDRLSVLDFLDPKKAKPKETCKNGISGVNAPKKPKKLQLGVFARSIALRQHAKAEIKEEEEEEESETENCEIFRSFTYEELKECFAPPLGDTITPPKHWPDGVLVSTLPRISWLPPGWGQGIEIGSQGREYRVYVAPLDGGYGRLVVKSKESMDTWRLKSIFLRVILLHFTVCPFLFTHLDLLYLSCVCMVCVAFLESPQEVALQQSRLRPLDQYGKPLGVGEGVLIERWPHWLPKTWLIAYFRAQGTC